MGLNKTFFKFLFVTCCERSPCGLYFKFQPFCLISEHLGQSFSGLEISHQEPYTNSNESDPLEACNPRASSDSDLASDVIATSDDSDTSFQGLGVSHYELQRF